MPIYEYQCECGSETEVRLSYEDVDQPQTCGCGRTMRRKMSVSSFVMRQTGTGMAMNTLNAKPVDSGLPNKWWKPGAEKAAARGL